MLGQQHVRSGYGNTRRRYPHADQVPGMASNVTSVAISGDNDFICAIKQEALYCWGHNDRGQLGQGDAVDRAAPTLVPGFGSRVTSVAAGRAHVCAVVNGSNYCWGDNSFGQLGLGTVDALNHYNPTLQHATYAGAVAANRNNTCMFVLPFIGASQGTLRCWGSNAYGQLGKGGTPGGQNGSEGVDINPPTITVNFKKVTLGWNHVCALTDVGAIYCWGNNANWQVADGTGYATRSLPAQVYNSYQVIYTDVSAGGDHTIAVSGDTTTNLKSVWTWGRGEFGQNQKGSHHYARPYGDTCMDPFTYPSQPLCDSQVPTPTLIHGVATYQVRGPVVLADGAYHTLFYATCGNSTLGAAFACSAPVFNVGGDNGDGQLGSVTLPWRTYISDYANPATW